MERGGGRGVKEGEEGKVREGGLACVVANVVVRDVA
jgi:hypothetical protein